MKKQNNVNASFKNAGGSKDSIDKLYNAGAKVTPPKVERQIFTLDVKFSVIAPPNVDQATLNDKIEKLVNTYLHENYDVSHVTIPGRPGMPSGTITELKHKVK